jgi:hypothetical protein
MFSRWIVTNITSASVTTFLTFLAGIISWSVYCSVSEQMLGGIFQSDREEVTGNWRKLHSEELHDLCTPRHRSLDVVKSKRVT